MEKNEKLNCLTRLAVIVTAIMYVLEYKYYLHFFLISILLILMLKYLSGGKKEDFTVTPTYTSTDFMQTTVAPSYSEEWHIPPPAYDEYTHLPDPDTFEVPLNQQSYPYGQYLTRTNLLPSDEFTVQNSAGLKDAREYANSAFLRHDLAFRDNMTRIYKKKLNRRFRNRSCNDSFSPYSSF